VVLATNEHKETILQVARFPPGTRLGKVSARAKVSSAHARSPWRAIEVFGPALGPTVAKQGAEYHLAIASPASHGARQSQAPRCGFVMKGAGGAHIYTARARYAALFSRLTASAATPSRPLHDKKVMRREQLFAVRLSHTDRGQARFLRGHYSSRHAGERPV
jgi:hypothetical protein